MEFPTMTFASKTIRRNQTKLIESIFALPNLKAVSYTLSAGFIGRDISVEVAKKELNECLFNLGGSFKMISENEKVRYVIRFHSNYWIELRKDDNNAKL